MIRRKDGFSGERALVLPGTVIRDLEADVYTSVLHITDIGYYPRARHHYRKREIPIDQFVFIYCTEGEGWFELNGCECRVVQDQYFILPAGIPHSYGADPGNPWTIYWIHFKGKLASRLAFADKFPADVRPGPYSRISDRIGLFEEIFHILEMGYSRENLSYACAVFHHYLGSLRNIRQYREAAGCREEKTDIVAAAIHYMQENTEKKLNLEAIAAHTGYSVSHFSVLFRERTGYTPLNYLNQLKIQKACRLIDFTDMKINQVCHKIGIEDSYYFSRLFTKIMGISPGNYRKLKKG